MFNFDIFDQFLPLENKQIIDEKILFKEKISLKGLCFKFPDAEDNVLNQLDLTIKKGEVIGVIGKSGSGKTTLMNILLGFLKQTKGSVLIDNIELSSNTIKSWQQKIGYVRQDVFLVDGNVRDNIAFGIPKEKVDHEKLMSVIKKAQLLDVINSYSEGVETNIGERGAKISGGQRQRVGIARALYHDAEVLFFDEATSALDSETESEITEAIKSLHSEELTMVIIAHRESTLKYCDKIIDLTHTC